MQCVLLERQLESSVALAVKASIARMGSGMLLPRRRHMSTGRKSWEIECNQAVVRARYAVRGAILEKAMSIEKDLARPETAEKWPFSKIVRCNIGNPQALGQSAPRFARQVLSLVMNPDLIDSHLYSEEAEERAKKYLAESAGKSVGAYSDSKGLKVVREEVASFIHDRDGYACDPENIYLTDGASNAVKRVVELVLTGDERDALMLPYPQYPLYSALVSLNNGSTAPYYLSEGDWGVSAEELELSYETAIAENKKPRAFVCINPGNPTGASLSREALETIVRFCQKKHLALLADEVYQENVYHGPDFISLRKVVLDLGAHDLPLFSFHSISKGFTGECGLRGGYLEVTNLHDGFKSQISKLANMSLCANVPGQIAVGLMVKPPISSSEAKLYESQREAILSSLKHRSEIVADTLDALPGISCPRAQGALYVFPSIEIPKRAIEHAQSLDMAPDLFYAMRLLENTGLVTVPGSGFGQREGTYHFRSSFLPSEADINDVMTRFESFHNDFIHEFADEEELSQMTQANIEVPPLHIKFSSSSAASASA